MFVQRGKTGEDEGETNGNKQKKRRNIDHVTRNECGEKVHYAVNSECSTYTYSSRMQKNSVKWSK